MNAPTPRMLPEPVEDPETTTVNCGPYTALVSEHTEREKVYLSVANGCGSVGSFLEPAAALTIAAALIEGAAKAVQHQFRRQMGSP